MACILVVADCEDGARMRLVLDEDVVAEDLATDSSCAELIERLGWAIVEAEELEHGESPAMRSETATPQGYRPRHRSHRRLQRANADRRPSPRSPRDSPGHQRSGHSE
jgi:hypothetical protein